ncbi:MAG: CAP domain-containing protein [Bacteroidota bacterium]
MNSLRKTIMIISMIVIISTLILPGCPDGEERGGADVQNILNELELSVFEQINQYRAKQGLTPLVIDIQIVTQARNHSQNMAEGTVPFSHEGLEERAAATGIKIESVSENVAYYQEVPDVATRVVNGWLQSEAHHKNIVGDFNLTGIGIIQNTSGRYYFTQIFIRSSESNWFSFSWLPFWRRQDNLSKRND